LEECHCVEFRKIVRQSHIFRKFGKKRKEKKEKELQVKLSKMTAEISMIMFVIVLLLCMASETRAGPGAMGLCYTACNAGAVACYGAAGLTFGTTPAGWWVLLTGGSAAAAACSAIQGTCMAACTPLFVAPTI
jgi:hypothetical protein